MRKITEQAVYAFYNCNPFKKANTEVRVGFIEGEWCSELLLYDSPLARYNHDQRKLSITTAGWNTPTTRERLNGLGNVRVTSKKGQLYLNDTKWDGKWTTL